MNKQAIKREFLKAVITGDRATAISLREELKIKPIHSMKIIAHSGAYQVEGKIYTMSELKAKIKQLQKEYSIRYYLLDIDGRTNTAGLGLDQLNDTPGVTGMQIY